MIDLFRSSKIPVIYANLYDRLTNVFSASEAEQIIEAILQNDNNQVPAVSVNREGRTSWNYLEVHSKCHRLW